MATLMERALPAALLTPVLTRGLGIREFRTAPIAESPTFLPLHQSSTQASVMDRTPTETAHCRASELGFHFLSIRDFHNAYQNGATTPERIAERVLADIAESDRQELALCTFISCYADDLRSQAQEATQRYKEGRPRGLLDGVPIAVKDEVDMVPYPTTGGTSFLGSSPAQTDSTVVERLRRAGAMLIGKTNMHEIGILPDSVNPHWGAVRNPYNVRHDAGGSSSGSAAAVAAGFCPVAIGAEGGGSIRIPAAFCGVVGVKPTFGRVSEAGALPLCGSVAHLGPIAATVDDAALMYEVIAGPNPGDASTLDQPAPQLPSHKAGLKAVRIGIFQPWFSDADGEVTTACERVIKELVRMGATLVDVAIPELSLIRAAHGLTIHAEMAANMDQYDEGHRSDFSWRTRLMLANVRAMRSTDYIQAQRIRTRAIQHFLAALTAADVIATPTTPVTAPQIDERSLPHGRLNVGEIINIMRFVNPMNITGIPAITIPVGYGESGMPIGLQFAARPWEESLLFELGYAAESIVARTKPEVHFDLLRNVRVNAPCRK